MAINLANPVNRRHPLMQGAVEWFKVLPSSTKGYVWKGLISGKEGVLTGNPTWVANEFGWGAISFNGSSQYIPFDTTTDTEFAGTAEFTVICSLKPSSANNGTYRRVISRESFATGWYLGISPASGGNKVNFYRSGPFIEGTGLTENVWSRVAIVHDSGNIRIYQNGVQTSSAADTSSISVAYRTVIGADAAASSNYGGLLDDAVIYNKALSSSLIMLDYQSWLKRRMDVLNRTRSGFATSIATSSFQSAWARGSNVLIRSMAI